MLNQLKESGGSELTKTQADWDSLQQKVRDLEDQLSASQQAVTKISSDHDELSDTAANKQMALATDDQASLAELKKFLEQAISDGVTLSPTDLLTRFTEATEKSAVSLAKKAEVSRFHCHISRFTMNPSYFSHCFTTPTNTPKTFCISTTAHDNFTFLGRDAFSSFPQHQLGKG